MLVSARPPCRLFTFASLLLCVIAPLIHCFIHLLNLRFVHFVNRSSESAGRWSIVPRGTMPECSFCEQKQRSNGTAAQRLTINTAVHARVDRCTEASTIASLRIESLRHSGAADHDRAKQRIPATLSSHCAAATMLLACILRRRSAVSDQTGRTEPGEA